MATHTSVTSVGKSFEDASTATNLRWVFHYFETNSQRLAGFLSALLQVASQMEEAFFGCFETRLNLDPELVWTSVCANPARKKLRVKDVEFDAR